MAYLLTAGLLLGAASAAVGMTVDHQSRVDHHSGPVAAQYRGTIAVSHQQVGAVAPAGKMSTLRCRWAANMVVDRHAVAASGATMTRQIEREAVLKGTRPGWCSTHRAAIAQEVADRAADMKGHLIDLAQEDHEALRNELDRIHGAQRAG
ncbi:hypothetical protein NF701_16420 [Sphingomonadaceae bacterium OTU29THOMA1]|nr:hypothetical protein NF699_18395 [Sphingomonadaceae bacterium OTU29LAMAA1]USU12089.1 hypothetical protein NF701_16420 [Sphingomonadaceae bacterium OTU29THOMA1]